MRKTVLLVLAGLTASVAQATVPFTVFQADFEGSSATDATDGSLTTNNLNAGTAVGSWSLEADGGTQGNHAAVITNAAGDAKALMLATGAYDATAIFSEITVLEGTTVSLDGYLRNKAGNAPENRMIGLDSSGREVFEIILIGHDSCGDPGYRAVGYRDASDTVHYLGTDLLQVQQNNEYTASKIGTLLLPLGAELDGGSDGTELIVGSLDHDGMLYLLSESGGVLNTYSNGSPFVAADVLTKANGTKRICTASYDNQIHFFDSSLNLLQTRAFSTDDRWPLPVSVPSMPEWIPSPTGFQQKSIVNSLFV